MESLLIVNALMGALLVTGMFLYPVVKKYLEPSDAVTRAMTSTRPKKGLAKIPTILWVWIFVTVFLNLCALAGIWPLLQ